MTHQVDTRKNHVYVFIRRDLPFSQIVVQACHAAIEAAPLISSDLDHPHLVVFGIKNEQHLQKALNRLRVEGVECRPFVEPDRGNELTAFATEPIFSERRHLFRRYNCLSSGFVGQESNCKQNETPSPGAPTHCPAEGVSFYEEK